MDELLYQTAEQGDLESLKDLIEKGCPWHDEIYNTIVGKGHLHMIKWLHQEQIPLPDNFNLVSKAVAYKQPEIAWWAIRNNYPVTNDIYLKAIYAENWNILKWAREQNIPFHPDTLKYALTHGHYDMFKWARDALSASEALRASEGPGHEISLSS
jgi:hypothetical protein